MIDEHIIEELREYIKVHYVPSSLFLNANISCTLGMIENTVIRDSKLSFQSVADDAGEFIKKNKTSSDFAHTLDLLMKEKGIRPAELYKKANIDRRQYSRLMGPEQRHPSKSTVTCFGLALCLSRPEFDGFLQNSGYALCNSSSRDVCIMYCVEKAIFNIDEVNALLFTLGIKPLSRE